MDIEQYNYKLPKEQIAYFPPKNRGDTKLLVIDKKDGSIKHRNYSDIVDYIPANDLIVLNNTKVAKVRLYFVDKAGKDHQVLFLPSGGKNGYKCLLGGSRGMSEGELLMLRDNNEITLKLGKKDRNDPIWEVELSGIELDQLTNEFGHVPLPPYIKREDKPDDEKRYNTVFAEVFGSSASPTASLNLTEDLLTRFNKKGVEKAFVTLDVGWGTFAPIRTKKIEQHPIHKETIQIDDGNSMLINRKINEEGDIWSFGTTVCRVLESVGEDGRIEPYNGETDLYIYPGYNWRIVDHLVTNFHAPKTSLLTLVASFMGYELMMEAYNEALNNDYKFLSYGDSMLII